MLACQSGWQLGAKCLPLRQHDEALCQRHVRGVARQVSCCGQPATVDFTSKRIVAKLPTQVVHIQDRGCRVDLPEPLTYLVNPGVTIVISPDMKLVAHRRLSRNYGSTQQQQAPSSLQSA